LPSKKKWHSNVQFRSDGNENSSDSSTPTQHLGDIGYGESVAGVHGIGAIKFTMLVDKRPCELGLLGLAFTY
jgi:hypothetical protein